MIFTIMFSVVCLLNIAVFHLLSSPAVNCSYLRPQPTDPPLDVAAVDQFTTHDVALIEIYSTLTGERLNDTLTHTEHEPMITVHFTAFNETFNLLLRRNRMMFSSSYVEQYYTDTGASQQNIDPVTEHCYYTGIVENDERDSAVAASTCNGFKGHIVTRQETYHVEPQSNDIHGPHFVFRDSDSNLPASRCGVTSAPKQFARQLINSRVERSLNWPHDLDGTTRVVELYIANSYAQYVSQGSNLIAVFTRTKNIVNVINSLYESQNIYVVLVGIEVWTSSERIVFDYTNSSLTLYNFLTYRNTSINPFHYNDNAHLITNSQFTGGVVGKAPVGTMCSFGLSGGINSDISAIASNVATSMAHEMGHNFGLVHDQDVPGCVCSAAGTNCIMNTYTNPALPLYSQWSSCSNDSFRYALSHGLDYCLKNVPTSLFDTSSYCGNGIIESGEQCDCGKSPLLQTCNSACCDPSTCQLIVPAKCASGRCCDVARCQLRSQGYECRSSNGQCDPSEYCNGSSSVCPSDIFKRDSTSCTVNGVAAYCYQGQCQSHDSQCQLLWGSSSSASDPLCYSTFNTRGDFAGNCRVNWNDLTYVSCAASDVMCGQLLCSSTPTLVNFASLALSTATASVRTSICNSVLIDTGTQRLSPSYVPNGAQCDTGKMCLNQRCVAVSSLTTTFPSCTSNCNGNGVCNSLGQCHCNTGYDPTTNCIQSGCGGSVHSGSPSSSSGCSSLGGTTESTTTAITSAAETATTTTSSPPASLTCYIGPYAGEFSPNAVRTESGCLACQKLVITTSIQTTTNVLYCMMACSPRTYSTSNGDIGTTYCCYTDLCNEATIQIASRSSLLLATFTVVVSLARGDLWLR